MIEIFVQGKLQLLEALGDPSRNQGFDSWFNPNPQTPIGDMAEVPHNFYGNNFVIHLQQPRGWYRAMYLLFMLRSTRPKKGPRSNARGSGAAVAEAEAAAVAAAAVAVAAVVAEAVVVAAGVAAAPEHQHWATADSVAAAVPPETARLRWPWSRPLPTEMLPTK
jgi:hypothetical protein